MVKLNRYLLSARQHLFLGFMLVNILLASHLHAQSDSSQKNKKDAIKAFQEIKRLAKKSDIKGATSHMTKEYADEYCTHIVQSYLDLVSFDFEGVPDDTKARLIKIGKKYQLTKFVNQNNTVSGKAQAKPWKEVLQKLEKAGHKWQALSEIYKEIKDIYVGSDPFQWFAVDQEIDGNRAVIELTISVPENSKENNTAATHGDKQNKNKEDSFAVFLTFKKKASGKWIWAGYDDEKNAAAIGGAGEKQFGEGSPLIENLKIEGINEKGKQIRLEDLKGKVVLVDFWGTWCGPCVAEIPSLRKIHQAFKDQGFEILGVASDHSKSLTKFEEKKGKLPWLNILDSESKLAQKYGITGFPTTLLIDQNGKHIATDKFGTALLDAVVKQLKLNPADYKKLRDELGQAGHGDSNENNLEQNQLQGNEKNEITFDSVDTDNDNQISPQEFSRHFLDRLKKNHLQITEIITQLDDKKDGFLSETEFSKTYQVVRERIANPCFEFQMPTDPGRDYAPVPSINTSVDDASIAGALFFRLKELAKNNLSNLNLDKVPECLSTKAPDRSIDNRYKDTNKLVKATVILACSDGPGFSTGGGVIVSPDGLILTNYHVVNNSDNSAMMAMTTDGRCFLVSKILAANKKLDIALIKINGKNLPSVTIAKTTPKPGETIDLVHHSENRFFTFDKGYVRRYSKICGIRRMEISPEYGPGGSGCGIFNQKQELVGLVSTIAIGDGPTLANQLFRQSDPGGEDSFYGDSENFESDQPAFSNFGSVSPFGGIIVKHAVPLSAVRGLWSKNETKTSRNVSNPKNSEKQFKSDDSIVSAMIVPATIRPGGTVRVRLTLTIPEGHHIYGNKNSDSKTTIQFKPHKQLTAKRILNIPDGLPTRKAGTIQYWLTGEHIIEQEFDIAENVGGRVKLEGSVNYTMCNDRYCKPPVSVPFAVTFSITATNKKVSCTNKKQDRRSNNKLFEPPVILTSRNKPINSGSTMHYPAATVFDIDGDGAKELIIGDVHGTLTKFENKKKQKGLPTDWSDPTTVESVSGELGIPNW